jgi:hypothetical protein
MERFFKVQGVLSGIAILLTACGNSGQSRSATTSISGRPNQDASLANDVLSALASQACYETHWLGRTESAPTEDTTVVYETRDGITKIAYRASSDGDNYLVSAKLGRFDGIPYVKNIVMYNANGKVNTKAPKEVTDMIFHNSATQSTFRSPASCKQPKSASDGNLGREILDRVIRTAVIQDNLLSDDAHSTTKLDIEVGDFNITEPYVYTFDRKKRIILAVSLRDLGGDMALPDYDPPYFSSPVNGAEAKRISAIFDSRGLR